METIVITAFIGVTVLTTKFITLTIDEENQSTVIAIAAGVISVCALIVFRLNLQ